MAFDFPAPPRTAAYTPGMTDNAARLKPTTGGPSQTIARPGNRFYLRVNLPLMHADCADEWLAVQLRHKTELGDVRLAWPQKTRTDLPAAAVVDGAGQAGALLAVKDLTPGQVIGPKRPFSFVSGGRSYLHMTSSRAVADANGKAILTVAPMLRVSPAHNLALNFLDPVIQGELDIGPVEWTVERLRFVGAAFTITEVK